jgi:hypothetical protein
MPPVPELVGVRGIARVLRVSPNTAATYTRRSDFPVPAAEVDGRSAWRRKEVERWATAKLPLRAGRPPKRAQ